MGAFKTYPNGTVQVCWQKKSLLGERKYKTFPNEEAARNADAIIQAMIDQNIYPDILRDTEDEKTDVAFDQRWSTLMTEFRDQTHIKVSSSAKDIIDILVNELDSSLKLKTITIEWLEEYIESLKELGRAPKTIRDKISTMSRVYDFAMRKDSEAVKFSPFNLLQKGYSTYPVDYAKGKGAVEDRELDHRLPEDVEEEMYRIIMREKHGICAKNSGLMRSEDPLQLKLIIMTAINTCARLSEVYTILVANIDFDEQEIQLTKHKNKKQKPRRVLMSGALADALIDYLENHHNGSPYLFPAYWRGSMDPKAWERISQKIGNSFTTAAERAGHPELTFHCTRHEGISRMFERTTMDSAVIAQYTGHRNPKTLVRYLHLRKGKMKKFMY